jgi:hypothetical protein
MQRSAEMSFPRGLGVSTTKRRWMQKQGSCVRVFVPQLERVHGLRVRMRKGDSEIKSGAG